MDCLMENLVIDKKTLLDIFYLFDTKTELSYFKHVKNIMAYKI